MSAKDGADAQPDVAAAVQKGYAFEGPALELGALVVDGTARPDAPVRIPLAMVNRHGLVAGATGTGKTKTLQLMAEQLSAAGVPVMAADIKGDLSGLAEPGEASERTTARATEVGQAWSGLGCSVELLALGGQGDGLTLRATMTSFGPTLLAKVLGLNEVQESSLGLVFHFADKAGLPMLDLKDLRAVVQFLTSDEGKEELKELGGLSRATAGVILRELVAFEDQGADAFFGEPEFDTADLMRVSADGRGIVSLLELPQLQDRPRLFSTFLMWLLADLFEELPEVGDVDKPKLVFFFDEAHLLFDDASKEFLTAIAQTVRLIRSKGVGVFFVTQTPKDVPDDVLAQLSNRVQHALRAHTPNDEAALRATVRTFPKTTFYDLGETLTSLGIGEAVVTVLDARGAPTPVVATRLVPPASRMAPLTPEELQADIRQSPWLAEYGQAIDRESAREMLASRMERTAPAGPTAAGGGQGAGKTAKTIAGVAAGAVVGALSSSIGRTIGREVVRGLFGLLGAKPGGGSRRSRW